MRKLFLTFFLIVCTLSVVAQETNANDSLAVSGKSIDDNKDALIEKLEKEKAELNSKIVELYDKVGDLEKENKSINAGNDKSKEKIKKLEADNEALKNELKTSTLKKKIKSLTFSFDSLKLAADAKDSVILALQAQLAEKDEYIARFDAYRDDFTKKELLELKPLLDEPFSKIELSKLVELQTYLQPYAVDSLNANIGRTNEWKNISEFLANVGYAINNKKRLQLCDSLIQEPFDAKMINALKGEIIIEKKFLTPCQCEEFDAKIELLTKYAAEAVELKNFLEELNKNRRLGLYRGSDAAGTQDIRRQEVKNIYADYCKQYKIDATRFEGLVYLSGLYSRFQAAYEKDPLKETGELEAVEQEIMKVAEQAELYNK